MNGLVYHISPWRQLYSIISNLNLHADDATARDFNLLLYLSVKYW
jgi:hypothetical protein